MYYNTNFATTVQK